MSAGRWARINDVFDAVLAAHADRRHALLRELAAGDEPLIAEVQSLLAAADRSVGLLDGFALDAISATDAGTLMRPGSLVGRTLGAYRVANEIGRGGMGVVYEGVRVDEEFDKRVAIKSLAIGFDRPELLWRFKRERQILAGLAHNNIAALHDGGTTDDGIPYLVMEFISGERIDEWCASHRLTIPQRLDLFRQVCSALQFAHGKLVVHRDLKPSNILVTDEGVVKLLDFGIAKLLTPDGAVSPDITRDGLAPLTTAYASPEQARGEEITTSADVYALGMVLYRLLTGTAPYDIDGKTPAQVLSILSSQAPRPPSEAATDDHARSCGLGNARRLAAALIGELDAIVLMALRKEPARRYASVAALSQDILRFLKRLPVQARSDTLGYRARKFVRRERAVVAGVAIAVLALIGGTVLAVRSAQLARGEARRATRMTEYLRAIVGSSDPSHYSTFRTGRTDVTLSEVLDSTRARVERDLVDEPRTRADLYWTLGSAFRAFNKHAVAALLLDSARILHERTVGPRSIEVARDVHFAALIHQETGRFDLAAVGFRDALARYQGMRAAPDSEVTDVMASLGQALGVGLQKLDEGEQMLRETERREASSARPRWALLGLAQTALGTTLSQGTRSEASDSAFARAVASFERDSVRSRGELAFTLTNWGTSVGRRGFRARAVVLKRKGLHHLESVYGAHHSLTAIFQQRLAEELFHLQELDEARVIVDSALVIQESLVPHNQMELCAALRLRGAIEISKGELAIAQRTLNRAQGLLDSLGQVRTPQEIAVAAEFARLYEATGRAPMARSELERALALAREKFGPSHVTTLVSISRLAAFSARTGDSARAASLRADSAAAVTKGLSEGR